jgi:DNA mismatch repair protein MutS2
MDRLISKLDLTDYIDRFSNFLSRKKPLFMEGDTNLHFRYIRKISNTDFTPPKEIKDLKRALMLIKKSGFIKLDEIYNFILIVEYFIYLKKVDFEIEIKEWLERIIIPHEIVEICGYFNEEGKLRDEIDERFLSINSNLKSTKEKIKETLKRSTASKKLSPYLVDSQIHYIDGVEALLLRGGFNHILKGSVVGRSSGGFFYVVPETVDKLRQKEATLLSQREEIITEYERTISKIFTKHERFLSFIDREFDRFDHYQARLFFAKESDMEFVKPTKNRTLTIKNFSHPALKDPKPISLDFQKKILLITGVNAGGKTMLLKSILSVVFLSKYLLPMKIDANNSTISLFKEITAIIDDPQNVKNDISTFAGRMEEFAKLFSKENFIAGVDEIELGTDSDEAAILFSEILKNLKKRDMKIVITTHHKKLASMMAKEDDVELIAALYDQEKERPTFEFLQGTIGKSYAFETAKRYGIPQNIISNAKKSYGEEQESLNELIQKNIDLELKLKSDLKELQQQKERVEKLQTDLKTKIKNLDLELQKRESELEKSYFEAIDAAKAAAKESDRSKIHKQLNIANKKRSEAIKKKIQTKTKREFKVGDRIKYQNQKGVILSIKKDEATIECEGIKFRAPLSKLTHSNYQTPKPPKQKVKISHSKPQTLSPKLDLHGLRSEEAIEKLDIYISDVLIAGLDEVLIFHGVGTGKLAFAVREFLKAHPKIVSFEDAPANLGGMGATVVRL